MNRGIVGYIGIFLTLAGFVFILNSISGITGYVITEDISLGESSIYGFIIVVGGLVLFLYNLGLLNPEPRKFRK